MCDVFGIFDYSIKNTNPCAAGRFLTAEKLMMQHWLKFEAKVIGGAKHEWSISNACRLASLNYLNESLLPSIPSHPPHPSSLCYCFESPQHHIVGPRYCMATRLFPLVSYLTYSIPSIPLQSLVQAAPSSTGDPCRLLRDDAPLLCPLQSYFPISFLSIVLL